MLYSSHYSSPLGKILLASDGDSLTGLWLEGQRYFAATAAGGLTENDGLPVLAAAKNWLDAYFAGRRPAVSDLPLAPRGGAFYRAVWDVLCEIPYGGVSTYGEVAKRAAARLGRPGTSARAAGSAVAHNPVSIIIPCHRVVGANGSLTGYAGGLDRKVWLLEHEGADLSRLSAPAKGAAL